MTYSNIINSLVAQFFLVACIVLLLMIGPEPRVTLIPPAIAKLIGIEQAQSGAK